MSKEKQNTPTQNQFTKRALKWINERLTLSDIISDAIRDWENYLEECYENGNTPMDDYEDYIADAVLGKGYRKQSEGEWVLIQNGNGVCSVCNRQDSIDKLAHFCRYCGAKMKGGEE